MSEQETKSERRLAAIMVTDIAGYSKPEQSDEARTFVALGTMRGAAEKLIRVMRDRSAPAHPPREAGRGGVRARRFDAGYRPAIFNPLAADPT
jgi:hypothetical protein